jgi:hypothetical protein
VLALGFSVSNASAAAYPCGAAYMHPTSAKLIKAALVQAFVSCNSPNDTTETGTVPSCSPAETYDEAAGSPPGGWRWGAKGKGDITFKASKNKLYDILNPLNSADLAISVKISQIEDETGPAFSNGSVQTLARATIVDRAANVRMTIIDFPTGFGIFASGGKVSKKTSASVILNGLSQPALPHCSNVELVSMMVKDPNGNTFATQGIYLP